MGSSLSHGWVFPKSVRETLLSWHRAFVGKRCRKAWMIPKKQNVEDLKDLRPISLVGGLYKILAKVLANRIKRVLGKVISPVQSAFVEGR